MIIGGFQKFSLIDYPGKIGAIVFTQGCNFRCPYCHNPELVKPRMFKEPIPEEIVLDFLEKRRGMLEGVVITGGEPLLQKDLSIFLRNIKKMGYAIKLDTNGSFPERLKEIINDKLVDYIAMDIKAPLEKYGFISGVNVNTEDIRRSIKIIMHSDLDYQFRTTVVKSLLSIEDVKKICELINSARSYVLQKFKFNGKIIDSSLLNKEEYDEKGIKRFQDIVANFIQGG
ncbi:MAG: anaerobic ribonucleoside-triphosphate reductase activating protein [Candidatus Neomarinimicrobiota bacterium]|nr:MAG: anaerobic ribonucleoside-triphosphate reductase activating protein [Candidatus Neomarinimicrobiota bacterium]